MALADLGGGHWPQTARAACAHFVLNTTEHTSLGVRLLADLRTIFTHHNTDRLPTKALLSDLTAIEEAPWGDLDGKFLDARRLSRELSRFNVSPATFKDDTNTTAKGYTTYPTKGQVGLADAWDRYLTTSTEPEGES